MPRRSLTESDLVSLARVALAGVFVYAPTPMSRLAVVAAAAASDWVDGWLARRHRERSLQGAVVDAAADRAFVVVVLATLVTEGALTLAQCLVLIGRDIATTSGVIIVRVVPALRATRLEARTSGKVVTALQFLVLVSAIAAPRIIPWLIPVVGVATAISILDYAGAVWRSRVSA
jgi:phosphatidylglycerophosphate synthase